MKKTVFILIIAFIGMQILTPVPPPLPIKAQIIKPLKRVENIYTCEMAAMRAKEIQTDFTHDKFRLIKTFPYNNIGENLAKGYKTKEEMYAAWHASPLHNKILHMNWQYSCLRCEGTYCVEFFAKIIPHKTI